MLGQAEIRGGCAVPLFYVKYTKKKDTMIGARALRRTIYIMSSDVISYSFSVKKILQSFRLIVNGFFA